MALPPRSCGGRAFCPWLHGCRALGSAPACHGVLFILNTQGGAALESAGFDQAAVQGGQSGLLACCQYLAKTLDEAGFKAALLLLN